MTFPNFNTCSSLKEKTIAINLDSVYNQASKSNFNIMQVDFDVTVLKLKYHFCLVIVVWLFLAMPQVCLQFVIVVFPDHSFLWSSAGKGLTSWLSCVL